MHSASTASYATTTGTNRLASITTPVGTRSISYDNRGNATSEARPGTQSVTIDYDGHGRMTTYARSGEADLTHAYNGLDDRISTTSITGGGTDTRRFVYAPDGRVLGEYGTSASDVKAEFIWMSPEVGDSGQFGGDDGTSTTLSTGLGGYMPLSVAVPTVTEPDRLLWVHGNHMGVPAVMTDATGTEHSFPTGYALPGFPGQSRTPGLLVADLYYNRYRDYDPTTGRYIQADPIGLAGGANPYSYALNNPLRYADPAGKAVFAIPAMGGGAGLGGLGAFCASGPWGWAVCGGGALAAGALIWYNWDDEDEIVVPERKYCPPALFRDDRGGYGRGGGGGISVPRGGNSSDDGDPRDTCHKKCVNQTVGRGFLDSSGRYRKCMRKCLKPYGIDY